MTLRDPSIIIPNYPLSEDYINKQLLNINEVDRMLRYAKKLRTIVLNSNNTDEEISEILDDSSLLESENEYITLKHKKSRNNSRSCINGIKLNQNSNKRKRFYSTMQAELCRKYRLEGWKFKDISKKLNIDESSCRRINRYKELTLDEEV